MENIKALLGDAFKEGMTLADIDAAIAGKKFADLNSGKYVDVNKYNDAVKKGNETQKAFDAYKSEKMTDEEKKKASDEALAQEYSNLRRELSRTKVEAVFAKYGMSEEDYKDFIDGCIQDDADKSVAMATAIGEAFKKSNDKTVQSTEARLLKGTTRQHGGSDDGADDDDISRLVNKNGGDKKAADIKKLYK